MNGKRLHRLQAGWMRCAFALDDGAGSGWEPRRWRACSTAAQS